jgi:TonB family protein
MFRWMAVALALLSITLFSPTRGLSQKDETHNQRKVTSEVQPQYPSFAHAMSLRGTVKLEVIISSDGSVKTVSVKGGHPVLAKAALEAVQKWKWAAAPQQSTEIIEIKFEPTY